MTTTTLPFTRSPAPSKHCAEESAEASVLGERSPTSREAFKAAEEASSNVLSSAAPKSGRAEVISD